MTFLFIDSIDQWLGIAANALTAIGILGLFLWWINRCLVRIHIRVPNFPDVNYNMLYIRDGGEGSKIVNKIHSFKKLNSKNTNEEIISIKIACNPQLGFQFKCFAELSGNEKQKKEMYPKFRQELEYLGFHSISQLAYDGKVWFLLPDEYLFGQIRASLVENIMNNIWYPTLAKTIYPYHSIIAKVPLKHDEYEIFDHAEYYLEVQNQNGTKDELFFGTLEKNEEQNYAKIKASVKIQAGFKPFKFKGIVKVINGKNETENVFKSLQGSTVNHSKIASNKIKNIGEEFSKILDAGNYTDKDLQKDKAVDTVGDLLSLVKKNKSKIEENSDNNDIEKLELALNSFVDRNKTEKSFSEYAEDLKKVIGSLDFKYDIIVSDIINEITIGIEFEDVYGFRKDGDYYIWNPEIK
jgi:hypothetical protein